MDHAPNPPLPFRDMTAFDDVLRELAAAPALAPTDPLVGSVVSHYRIVSRIGSGATGVVYRAFDERLGRPLAIKVLRDGSAGDYGRILAEARAAALVQHPNVAAIYDVGGVGSIAFVAMELVEGVLLASRVRAAPLSVDEACRIVGAVASGLGAAHRRGLVHGDIKPDNVALDRDGRAKILDFGAACPAGRPPSRGRGAHAYASPEQWRGDPIDPRSDVYSLGRLLDEISNQPLPAKLRRIVARACAKDPTARFHDAVAFELALVRATRKRSWVWLLAAALVMAGVAVALGVGWFVSPGERGEHKSPLAELRSVTDASVPSTESLALSPDGRRLVYAEDRGLVVRDLETGRTRGLWLDRRKLFGSIRFTADGERVLVDDTHDLHFVDVASGAREPLGVGAGVSGVPLPSNAILLYEARGFVLHHPTDPAAARVLVGRHENEALFPYDVSPDGKRVVFVHRSEIGDSIEIFDIDEPRPRVLAHASRLCDRGPVTVVFSGETLLVAAGLDERFKVHAFVGDDLERYLGPVLSGERGVSRISALASGRIALQTYSTKTSAYVASLDGRLGTAERASLSELGEAPSSFTVDGSALWVVERGDEGATCARVDLRTRVSTRPFAGDPCNDPFELADGTVVRWKIEAGRTFFARGSRALFAAPSGTDGARERGRSVRCTLDGRCFSADLESGVVFAIGAARVREIARVGSEGMDFLDFAVSRDGTTFALAQRYSDRVWIVREGVAATFIEVRGCEVLGVEAEDPAWLVAAFCAARPRYNLLRYRGDTHEIVWASDTADLSRPVRSPDGRSLAFESSEFRPELFVADLELE
jgi:hypothetical protein